MSHGTHALLKVSTLFTLIAILNIDFLWKFSRKRDGDVVAIDPKRMEGGDVDGIALKIRDVTRYDAGNYTCELENEFGQGVSANGINVDVHCKYEISLKTCFFLRQ